MAMMGPKERRESNREVVCEGEEGRRTGKGKVRGTVGKRGRRAVDLRR